MCCFPKENIKDKRTIGSFACPDKSNTKSKVMNIGQREMHQASINLVTTATNKTQSQHFIHEILENAVLRHRIGQWSAVSADTGKANSEWRIIGIYV